MSIEEAINLINDLPKFTTKHTPEEGKIFLERLGRPDLGMRIIHVAGTNGKGSVCAYMESILMHAGLKTACFISPHLVDMRERIRIDGKPCSEEAFIKAVDQVCKLAEELYYPTFFEFLFFVSMLVFAEEKTDVVILETGLGGRLDATNLVENKDMCIITSIGLDHCEYLGNTVEDIAREKAGIMRPHVPVVFWNKEYASVLHKCALECDSVEYALSEDVISDVIVDNHDIDFCLNYHYHSNVRLKVDNCALYQVDNAALAVCALTIWDEYNASNIGAFLKPEDYISGIFETYWPGRMEEIVPYVYLDGAHNVPAIIRLLETVRCDGAARRELIFGCMSDKQYDQEIRLILESGLFDKIVVAGIASSRAESTEQLLATFDRICKTVFAGEGKQQKPEIISLGVGDIAQVYNEAVGFTRGVTDRCVYIAGSLYLVGNMVEYISTLKRG